MPSGLSAMASTPPDGSPMRNVIAIGLSSYGSKVPSEL